LAVKVRGWNRWRTWYDDRVFPVSAAWPELAGACPEKRIAGGGDDAAVDGDLLFDRPTGSFCNGIQAISLPKSPHRFRLLRTAALVLGGVVRWE